MKKFILLAAAIVAMASCTKKLEPANLGPSNKEITFEGIVAPATKATSDNVVSATSLPEAKGFKVFAKKYENNWVAGTTTWASATNYFANAGATAEYDATKKGWTTNPKYYWPKQSSTRLAFQAYAPADAAGAASTATGITFTNYEIATTRDGQVDLLYSNRVYDKTTNDETYVTADKYYGVDLTFNHALTQVAFTAKLSPTTTLAANEWIKITSIKLVNVKTKGSFNQNWNDNTNTAGIAAWADLGYKQVSSTDVKEYDNTVIDYANVANTDPNYLNELAKLTDTKADTDFYPYLVIPQSFDTTLGQESKLVVTYVTKLGANNEEVFEVNTVDILLEGLTYTATPAVDQDKFLLGKKYIYNIIIGLDPIYFDPNVTAWVDVEVTGTGLDIK